MYCVENRFTTAQMRATQIQREKKMCLQSVVSSKQSAAFGVEEHIRNETGKYYQENYSEVKKKRSHSIDIAFGWVDLQAEFSICRRISACLCAECRMLIRFMYGWLFGRRGACATIVT